VLLFLVMNCVFIMCVCVNRIMKRKSLEFVAKSNVVWFFASSRNIKNAKPLWLVCDFMPLFSDGNGLSKFSCSIIHGPHSLILLNVALP